MNNTAREAAQLLWRHRCDGTKIASLPDALLPRHSGEGDAIQGEWPTVSGQAVVGWKIAATSAAGQAHINVSAPLPGRILARYVHAMGLPVSLAGNCMRVVEPEYAFRFGKDLTPCGAPRTTEEIRAALESLHPAFEVPDSRFADFTMAGEAQLLADNACCGDFVFGPAAPDGWRDKDLRDTAVQATVRDAIGRQRYTRAGSGRAALGDPYEALAWLTNRLSAMGVTLLAGQYVSTGTCMTPLEVNPGDSVYANYGVLGTIALQVSS